MQEFDCSQDTAVLSRMDSLRIIAGSLNLIHPQTFLKGDAVRIGCQCILASDRAHAAYRVLDFVRHENASHFCS